MNEGKLYRIYSKHLQDKYGQKVYKLPINLPLTCPNRDGCVGTGGCIFCGEVGAGFENLSSTISVQDQLKQNMDYIRNRYNAQKFIAYFQNFSNTYTDFDSFKAYMERAIIDDIVEISISTRPDCITDEYMTFLSEIKDKYEIEITVELGLQSVNYHTLKKINRGHTLGEFLDAVLRIKKFGLQVCTHLILNLPWDSMIDVIENAKVLSALSMDYVKLHSLYVVKDTVLADMLARDEIKLVSKDEYVDRVIRFLEYLDKDIVIQRLIGRAPEENTVFVNWNTSWWKIKDEILAKMERQKTYQGSKCDYLNGKALRKF